jgi:hypothetical protein
MFESCLIPVIRNEPTIAALVKPFKLGTGATIPGVFAEMAPETAELPYIVVRIDQANEDPPVVAKFNVNLDYFDYGTDHSGAHKAIARSILILNRLELQHPEYDTIRIFFSSAGSVREDDARAIHENATFTARAGRIDFADRATTLEN